MRPKVARAPLTFFDAPYLGLDAVARQIVYGRLLEDYAEHPRTVILYTHLIDEVSNLLEHVLIIDEGRILMDQDAEQLRGTASTVVTCGAPRRASGTWCDCTSSTAEPTSECRG